MSGISLTKKKRFFGFFECLKTQRLSDEWLRTYTVCWKMLCDVCVLEMLEMNMDVEEERR